MKTEKTKIHFLSDVLIAVAPLDLKVPNYDQKQQTLQNRNIQNGSKSTNHKSETMTF